MKKIFITLFLLFATAFTPIAARIVVTEISPLSLAFIRFGIAAILLNLVFHYKKLDYRIERIDRMKFVILGALVIPINQFFFLKGISLSTASHSGIIYSITPLFAFLFSIKIKQEEYSLKKLLTILISIAGIVIIFYENLIRTRVEDSTMLWGDVLLVFAVLSWSAYLILSKEMVHKYGAVKTSTISFSTGLILYIPVFLFDMHNLDASKITLTGLLGFIHLSIIVSFGSYFLFTYSSKFISVSSLTTSLNSSPIITIIFSWLLLKEELSYFFIIGSLVTLTGVYLSNVYQNKQKRDKELSTQLN